MHVHTTQGGRKGPGFTRSDWICSLTVTIRYLLCLAIGFVNNDGMTKE